MQAERQIEQLLYIYAELIDGGDFRGIGQLFSRGRIVDAKGNQLARGAVEVEAMYVASTRIYPEVGTPLTKHVVTNPVITINSHNNSGNNSNSNSDSTLADSSSATGPLVATCRSYFTVLQATPTLPLQPIITGRYHDTFTQNEPTQNSQNYSAPRQDWYFTERKMIMDQLGDLSQHLLIEVSQADI